MVGPPGQPTGAKRVVFLSPAKEGRTMHALWIELLIIVIRIIAAGAAG